MSKPRCVINFKSLGEEVKTLIKARYPYGFDKHLVTFKNSKGKFTSALPFETDNAYYLIKMTRSQAQSIFLNQLNGVKTHDSSDVSKVDLAIAEIPEQMGQVELGS